MAKIEKLKKDVEGVSTTIYPVTIPQAVIDPTSAKSVRAELDEKANHGYESDPKTLKVVDDAKADHGYESNPKSLKEVDDEKAAHGYGAEPQKTLKQVDDEVIQLAGDVSLLDAVQGAKIKDIENVLSTANLGQSTQVSVSGRKTISLPKNASNGGMSVKLEGLTAENIVVNGNFANGITGWTNIGSTLTHLDTAIRLAVTSAEGWLFVQRSLPVGVYYVRMRVRSIGDIAPSYIMLGYLTTATQNLGQISNPVKDQWYDMSYVSSIGGGVTRFPQIVFNNTGAVIEIDKSIGITAINLGDAFGVGNEPTKEQCDIIFSDYFEGVKSFVPTGRVRSVGKNLFDKYKNIPIAHTTVKQIENGVNITGRYFAQFAVKLPAGSTYRISWLQTTVSGTPSASWRFSYIDGTLSSITPNGGVKLAEKEVSKIYLYVSGEPEASANYTNIILSRTVSATAYEPYKETNLYLTAPELRSNGAVKDEIRKGANGYELAKRVGVGTLGSELILNGGFDTDTWWIKGTEWSIANGVASTSSKVQIADLTSPSIITKNTWYVVTFEVKDYVRGGIESVFSGDATTSSQRASSNGIKTYLIFSRNAFTSMIIRGFSFVGSIDNVSVKKLTIQDDAPLDKSIPRVYGGMANYTLAETQIIPISHGGILNSAENGTVYHEPIIADAGVYGTNMPILLTDYPIASLEEIIIHKDGIDTYLDVSTAVIAPDGLSFTHPDLASGDLVLFTYAFDKESTNGNITATFYDSNVVKIDTVTGKVYKITDVVTDGVLTRTLTEV